MRARPRILLLALLLALPGACGGGDTEARAEGRGLLVVAVDALRRDHLELNGYDRRTSPWLTSSC